MEFEGTYQTVSHFWKRFQHPGSMEIHISGSEITGTVHSPGIAAAIESGQLNGSHFSFCMRKGFLVMQVDGEFTPNGVVGTMRAPFGTSHFEGTKVNS